MWPAHHAPADHDIERQLTKGVRLFQCTRCDMEFRVATDEDAETDEEG